VVDLEERVIANRFMGSQFQATTIKVHSTDNTVMAIEVGLNDEKCSIFTKRIVCMYLCMYCTGAIIVCMYVCVYVCIRGGSTVGDARDASPSTSNVY